MCDDAAPTLEIDVDAELSELERLIGTYEQRATDGLLERTRREVSGWSVGRHVSHVAVATAFSLRNVLEIADGGGGHTQTGGALGDIARSVLVSGRIPRGAAAPVAVDILEEPDVARVRTGLEICRKQLERARARASELSRSSLRIAHPLLGPLDELEWLRFARIHAAHHLEIVDEIDAG